MTITIPANFVRKLRNTDYYIAGFNVHLNDYTRAYVRYSYYRGRQYLEDIPYIVQWGGTPDSFLYIILPKNWEAFEGGRRAKSLAKENFPDFKGFDSTSGLHCFKRSKTWLPTINTIKNSYDNLNVYGCALPYYDISVSYPDHLEFEVEEKRTPNEFFFSLPPRTEAYRNYFNR